MAKPSGAIQFSILPKDTLTHGLEEPGIKPPIFRLVDDLLYLLSHSHPDGNRQLMVTGKVALFNMAPEFDRSFLDT